jgi:hypothetical protein
VGEAITQTRVADPGLRPPEFRLGEAKSHSGSELGGGGLESLEGLIRRVGVEAVVRRERAKAQGSLEEYLRASHVLNLTEHRLEPEKLKSITTSEQASAARLFDALRRDERIELQEVALVLRLKEKLSSGGHQGKDELRFTIQQVGAPLTDSPTYALLLSLPEGRDPRDWVRGQTAGRRLDRRTGAILLTASSPALRNACNSLLQELPNGVGSIRFDDLKRLLAFAPTQSARNTDSFEHSDSSSPAAVLLRTALLRHPEENRIHLLPRSVLRTEILAS